MANYYVKHHIVNDGTNKIQYPAGSIVDGLTVNALVLKTKEHAIFEELTGATKNGTVLKFEPETVIAGLNEL